MHYGRFSGVETSNNEELSEMFCIVQGKSEEKFAIN